MTSQGFQKFINRIGLLINYSRSQTAFRQMPNSLVIEATNRCQMNCIMCPREAMASTLQDMPLDLFKKIIDQTADFIEYVDFALRGEPLLNRDIYAMINYAKTKGIYTGLQTNGLLLTKENCETLLASGLDYLAISLEAVSEKTYDKIRKQGCFKEVMTNTKNFIEMNNISKKPIIIIAQMIDMPENHEETVAFKASWKGYKHVLTRIKPLSSRSGLIRKHDFFSVKHKTRCSRIWKTMFILADGTVVPCCNDYKILEPLGNLHDLSIKDVWMGPDFIKFRNKHCKGDFQAEELCDKCEILQVNYLKHIGTFVVDGLMLRKIMAKWDMYY